MVLLKTLLFTVLVPGTVTLYVPYRLLGSRLPAPPEAWQYFGLLPIVLGAAAYLRCAFDFTFAGKGTPAPIDPPKELVIRGLYRYSRNPMYVGVLSILLGEAWLFQSVALLEYAAGASVFFHLFVVLYEEPALTRKFGDSYRRYRQSSSRWIWFAGAPSRRVVD